MNPVYFNNQLTPNKTRTVFFFPNTYQLITEKYSYSILKKKIHLTDPTPSTRCGLVQYFSG